MVFEKLVEVLVFGGAYWRIVDEECSATSLRRRRDEWIKTRVMDDLWEMALETYDRLLGLELVDLAVDCCITKAPCGGEKAGKSPVDRGKRGIKRSRRVKRATISTTTRCGCLTGAEAATSSGVLLPSTRAFGHVPLTGEVDKSRGMERAPVAQEEDTNELFADRQPRCEIGKALTAEGECQRLGEIQLDGSRVCVTHQVAQVEGTL